MIDSIGAIDFLMRKILTQTQYDKPIEKIHRVESIVL
jgi:hypothetical protein